MSTNRTANLRKLWRLTHRWSGLGIGWLLALVALCGSLLVVGPAIDRWLNPQLFVAAPLGSAAAEAPPPISLEDIHTKLSAAFGDQSGFTLRLPRKPDDTLRVSVRGKQWNGSVYLNPTTGQEQGRRGEYEGIVNLAHKFHSNLFLDDTGKAILAGISLLYLALLVSGLILWWPRQWPPSLRIVWHKGALRSVFDLHRTAGAVLGVLMAVTLATGAYMAWRPLAQWVTSLSGEQTVMPPKIGGKTAAAESPATLDDMARRAQAEFPDDRLTYIQIPAEANRPLRIRMRLADDPHPNGRTSIWLHPQNGAILAVDRWNRVDPGARALSVIFPLHTGELGGPALEALVFIFGLTLGGLGFSGIWLWWRRRKKTAA